MGKFQLHVRRHAGSKRLPDIGPKWEILPNQGRGSEPGSKIDIMRFDFFLLSAWEYNMPYHSALRKKQAWLRLLLCNVLTVQSCEHGLHFV